MGGMFGQIAEKGTEEEEDLPQSNDRCVGAHPP